jgi:hypothetical protein
MAPLPAIEREGEEAPPRARVEEEGGGDDGFVRRSGDLPHEPPPRPQ